MNRTENPKVDAAGQPLDARPEGFSRAGVLEGLNPSTESLPRLMYSMQETAVMLGVAYITVHRLVQRGLLKRCNSLRHVRIPAKEIERFITDSLG